MYLIFYFLLENNLYMAVFNDYVSVVSVIVGGCRVLTERSCCFEVRVDIPI